MLKSLTYVPELAVALGVNQETIRRWVKRGHLPQPTKIGSAVFWPTEVLDLHFAKPQL